MLNMFVYHKLIVNRIINSALLIKVNLKYKSAIRINTDILLTNWIGNLKILEFNTMAAKNSMIFSTNPVHYSHSSIVAALQSAIAVLLLN